ncbi:MAG: AAA family ATPase, partial [Gammaproteobacteria bacterium]|nr:AAA family ATPase [Gammaproteobacteria bacterium]
MGPRQSGKTTVAHDMIGHKKSARYLSWDNTNDRDLILRGTKAIADDIQLSTLQSLKPIICFDEIHKYHHWRDLLKGFYDSYPDKTRILVTGSAKLDAFSRGGDSLMGRYFPFHFHPLSVAEIIHKEFPAEKDLLLKPKKIDDDVFQALWKFGGYPDPFLKQGDAYHRRWQKLRSQQIFQEDIRDLTRIQDLGRLELLAE